MSRRQRAIAKQYFMLGVATGMLLFTVADIIRTLLS